MYNIKDAIIRHCLKRHASNLSEAVGSLKELPFVPEFIFQNIRWDEFDDGSPNNFFENNEVIKGSDVFFIADFEDTNKIFNRLGPIYALPHYGAKSLTVFIPYFPTATMERVGNPGQIATAKTLMRMLNAIPHCHGSGPTRVIIYDIHSLAVQHFHGDGIIVELQSAIPLFLQQLDWPRRTSEKLVFAFPDDGAKKRFHNFFLDPCVICSKDENKQVTIKDGLKFIDGNHVVIIDDMVRNGDTIINCEAVLRHYGASAVSAYVTHGVFPKNSWHKFCNPNFTYFWVTDSCEAARNINYGSFKIISLSNLIYEEISRS
jgi:ribose-phosphate pyrophosphokinase